MHTFILLLTFFFCKLMKQARFAYSHIPYNDIFKDVGIVIWAGRHLAPAIKTLWKNEVVFICILIS